MQMSSLRGITFQPFAIGLELAGATSGDPFDLKSDSVEKQGLAFGRVRRESNHQPGLYCPLLIGLSCVQS